MKYRKFGKLDWEASALGFGCMRFPTDGDDSKIKKAEATEMLHYAIDNGVNYLDTAYNYHDGKSEVFLGEALKNGYREKVKIATKLLPTAVNSKEDIDRVFDEQLKRLQMEYVDFYLLHGVNRRWFPKLQKFDIFEWVEQKIADGQIKYIGFSFHDEYEIFEQIVDAYDKWTFTQIFYNYMSTEHQAGTKGLKYAAKKDLAVVVMGPLLGSYLSIAPPAVEETWNSYPIKKSPSEWGLQWLWNQPEVSVVLSGMSNLDQVKENINSATNSAVGGLSEDDLALIIKARDVYHQLRKVPCTSCNYCMPCPNTVDIPYNFKLLNDGFIYENIRRARGWYGLMGSGNKYELEGDFHVAKGNASHCTQCKECEPHCPQNINISEWMPIVHQVLGEGKSLEEFKVPEKRF